MVLIITAAVVIIVLASLLARRNLRGRWGRLEFAIERIEQINRQVNHVENPETEPTLRELVCEVRAEMSDMRDEVGRELSHLQDRCASIETAQLALNERVTAIGILARDTADIVHSHLPKENP